MKAITYLSVLILCLLDGVLESSLTFAYVVQGRSLELFLIVNLYIILSLTLYADVSASRCTCVSIETAETGVTETSRSRPPLPPSLGPLARGIALILIFVFELAHTQRLHPGPLTTSSEAAIPDLDGLFRKSRLS